MFPDVSQDVYLKRICKIQDIAAKLCYLTQQVLNFLDNYDEKRLSNISQIPCLQRQDLSHPSRVSYSFGEYTVGRVSFFPSLKIFI